MKLLVETLNEGSLLEACHRIDDDNVAIIQLVPTKVGFKARVQIGLHEYGGNMVSYEYDHGLVEFFTIDPDLHVKIPLGRGYIKNGDFKCFLRSRPSNVRVHTTDYELEYANEAIAAK